MLHLVGSQVNVCFSLESRLGPMYSVFQFWNASITRLGPMYSMCFGFGMSILQGWVPSPMCV